jgi:response regulator RpfG family c-di-GMP phosphodiesterase
VDSKKYSILVVDDDPPILELLGEYLSTRGHDCKMASSTAQGLDMLETSTFDVLITDLKMPGGGGLQLLKAIEEKGLSIATVMMTGYGTIESALQAMKYGAHDYLLKPFKLRDVYNSMEQAISNRLLEKNTVRLRHIIEIQEIAANTYSTKHLEDLYDSIATAAMSELEGTGAIVTFFESERGVWQEYARTSGAPVGRIDLQSIGEALQEGRDCDDKLAWFSDPRPIIVVPIHAATGESENQTIVGFIGVTDPLPNQVSPHRVLKVYGSIVGAAISLCLAKSGAWQEPREVPVDAKNPEKHSPIIEGVVSNLGLTPEESETVKSALKISTRPHSTLRELYNGAPVDAVALGGEALPFEVLSRLEPLMITVSERYDGQGTPSGLSGEEIDKTAQAVHILSLFDTITSTRSFAHKMSNSEALNTIRSRYAGAVSPDVLAVFTSAVEKTTQD